MYGISSRLITGYLNSYMQLRTPGATIPTNKEILHGVWPSLRSHTTSWPLSWSNQDGHKPPRFKGKRCRPHILDGRSIKTCSLVLRWPLFFDLLHLFSPLIILKHSEVSLCYVVVEWQGEHLSWVLPQRQRDVYNSLFYLFVAGSCLGLHHSGC